ncbi:MAG: hypothetical protein R3185_06070, partial [Candidatus Thermoplasmatota archaeon]|nr:hypothetical protein [Candidatus Thermoplasmatota archaeon]
MARTPSATRAIRHAEQAASDVVTQSLILLLAILMTGAIAMALNAWIEPESSPNLRVLADSTGTSLDLLHRGGDAAPVATSTVALTFADGTTERRPLSDYAPAGIGATWDNGERLCITGTETGVCLIDYGGKTLTGLDLVVAA